MIIMILETALITKRMAKKIFCAGNERFPNWDEAFKSAAEETKRQRKTLLRTSLTKNHHQEVKILARRVRPLTKTIAKKLTPRQVPTKHILLAY